ncbi:MAG: aminoglycoside 6'-N-acetyltransferase [Burkholderiales bacterium]
MERCRSERHAGWVELRDALWPQPRELHLAEMAAIAAEPRRHAAFIAYVGDAQPAGLAEAALRSDYVNGTQSSPVAFLEGIYVAAPRRRQGIARALVTRLCAWAREVGAREIASDALVENQASDAVHRGLGFVETERVVFYRKPLV